MLTLYQNIKALRLERGWTQTELAKRAGYSDRSMISRIEGGTVSLPAEKIKKFAEIFGVDAGDLMGPDGCIDAPRPEIVEAYNAAPHEIQFAVRRLLGLKD